MKQSMNEIIEKANIIVEALPYINAYAGKTLVIKYGGNAMSDPKTIKTIMQDVATLRMVGVNPVIVHGGGPDINTMLKRLNVQSRFENGLRVTDKETMEVVEMVLGGKVNKSIVALLNTMGVTAVGLSGKDGNLIEVDKMQSQDGIDYGFVGEIKKINAAVLNMIIEQGFVPVIATIGVDKEGNSYNINADTVAAAIGGALNAEKLMYLTDIDGIRREEKDPSTLIPHITVAEIGQMISSGAISGGMIPKVRACTDAIELGLKNVLIVNGTIPHSILLELFTDSGIGTMVTRD